MDVETPELSDLMAYYHEDYDLQGGLWGTLDFYLGHATRQDKLNLLQDISVVLESMPSDSEVDAHLGKLSSTVLMTPEDGGYRGWLEEIARRVRVHLGA